MQNVNHEAVEESAREAGEDPGAARQQVSLSGEWQHEEGAPLRTSQLHPHPPASDGGGSEQRHFHACLRTRSPKNTEVRRGEVA